MPYRQPKLADSLIFQQSQWNSGHFPELRKSENGCAEGEACHVSEGISRIRGRVHAFGKNGQVSQRAQGLSTEGGSVASGRRSMETANLTPQQSGLRDSISVGAKLIARPRSSADRGLFCWRT